MLACSMHADVLFFLCSNTPGTAAMGLLEECYDVLRDNTDANILLDDLGVRVAEDLRLLDEEDFAPMLVVTPRIPACTCSQQRPQLSHSR